MVAIVKPAIIAGFGTKLPEPSLAIKGMYSLLSSQDKAFSNESEFFANSVIILLTSLVIEL